MTGAGWASDNASFGLHGTDRATATASTGDCLVNCHNNNEIYSFHTGGANILFADGSVHFIRQEVDPIPFVALVTKHAGDKAPPPGDL